MKGCANWRDAVADCALGVAQGPAFEAHLASCSGCTEALRESQTAAARMNATFGGRATAGPPDDGPDRVMAHIAARDLARTNLWWKWALVGCVVAVLIASVPWSRRSKPQPGFSALATWRSPTEVLLQPPVGTAWRITPLVGEGLFELKSSGEKHAQ